MAVDTMATQKSVPGIFWNVLEQMLPHASVECIPRRAIRESGPF